MILFSSLEFKQVGMRGITTNVPPSMVVTGSVNSWLAVMEEMVASLEVPIFFEVFP